jgi:HEAT repeat protein
MHEVVMMTPTLAATLLAAAAVGNPVEPDAGAIDLRPSLVELGKFMAPVNPQGRDRVLQKMADVAKGKERAAQAISQALHDKDARVREAAAYALGEYGPAAHRAVRALSQALSDSDKRVRGRAAFALTQMIAYAEPAIPALIRAAKDSDPHVRSRAINVLEMLGPKAKDAVPVLIAALTDPDDPRDADRRGDASVPEVAALALARIGPAARGAVPRLLELARKDKGRRRNLAMVALGNIGWNAKEVVPLLMGVLKSKPSPPARVCAAGALAGFGEAAEPALPVLLQTLDVRDVAGDKPQAETIRANVCWALGAIGPKHARKTVPVLVRIAADRSAFASVRCSAADALGRIGPAARDAVPALQAASEDRELEVRDHARRALKKVQGDN